MLVLTRVGKCIDSHLYCNKKYNDIFVCFFLTGRYMCWGWGSRENKVLCLKKISHGSRSWMWKFQF